MTADPRALAEGFLTDKELYLVDPEAVTASDAIRVVSELRIRRSRDRLTDAIRKEAFVQGYLASEQRGTLTTKGRRLTEEETLALLPHADRLYAEWRMTGTP